MYLCGAQRVFCTLYSNEPYLHHTKSKACILYISDDTCIHIVF